MPTKRQAGDRAFTTAIESRYFRPDSTRFRVSLVTGGTSDSIGTLDVIRSIAGDTARVAQNWRTRVATSSDTVDMNRRTLRLRRRVAGAPEHAVHVSIDDKGTIVMSSPAGADTITASTAGAAPYEASVIDALASAITATSDGEITLPLLSSGERGIGWSQLVSARNPRDPTQRLVVAHLPNAVASIWLDNATRRVERVVYDYGFRQLEMDRVGSR